MPLHERALRPEHPKTLPGIGFESDVGAEHVLRWDRITGARIRDRPTSALVECHVSDHEVDDLDPGALERLLREAIDPIVPVEEFYAVLDRVIASLSPPRRSEVAGAQSAPAGSAPHSNG